MNQGSRLDESVSKLASTPRDSAAWEELFAVTWPFVLTLAHRYLRGTQYSNLADAEDLAQEVFFRLARAWHSRQINVRDGNSLRALLAVITRRLAIDHVRSQHRLRRDIGNRTSVDVGDRSYTYSAESSVEWEQLLNVVARQLTDDERRVLELRLQGYDVKEIATRFKVATRTIERRLAHIRNLLQGYIEFDVQ